MKSKDPKQLEAERRSTAEPSLILDSAERGIKQLLKHKVFAAALLFLVSFAVFAPSLRNGLVWDDITYVKTLAPKLKSSHLDIKRLFSSRSENSKEDKYFRPAYSASLIIDNRIWGLSPFGFHLTNIILHSVSTVLLYFLILLVLKEFNRGSGESEAFLGAMLFALFPLHVESVSFIAARGDLLAAMFFMLCLIFYIMSYRRFHFIFVSGICLYLSFLSKEVAFSFPIIILGFDLISRRFFARASIYKYLMICLLIVFYFYVRFGSIVNMSGWLSVSGSHPTREHLGFGSFITLFLGTYLFYCEKLLFPYDLNHFIGAIAGGDATHIIISLMLVAAVIVAFVISIMKRENITAYSLLWIFATLGPAVIIALYPIAITRYAERFVYVPSAGYCMLVGYLIVRGGSLIGRKWLSLVIGGLLCASYLFVVVKGQEVWRGELTFWQAAVKKSPDQIVPKLRYGEALESSGRTEEAISQFLSALSPAIESDSRGKAMAAHGLGIAYIAKGDYIKAEQWFKAALEYNPSYESMYNFFMGFVSDKRNDPENAKMYLLKALDKDPRFVKAHYYLGFIYLKEAISEKSIEKYGLAERSLKDALKYDPTFAQANILLARLYLSLGEKKKAMEQIKEALEFTADPGIINQASSIQNEINMN